jgi:hypothetical protein
LQARFNEAKALLSEQGLVEDAIPHSLKAAMAARISVEEARRLGEMRESELFDGGVG